jgi:hypothetical protein
VFDKARNNHAMEQESFQQVVLEQLDIPTQKTDAGHKPCTFPKNELEMDCRATHKM